MTDAEITYLLAKRDKMLERRDGLYDSKRVKRIEAKLATVPPGQRNDVDTALGRMCATLEKYTPKEGWFTNPSVTMEDESTQRLIAETARIWNETKAESY